MITSILCGLFPYGPNMTLFPLCQKKIAFVSTQLCNIIKAVHCDNGREFDNTSSRAFFTTNRVILRMSCPYTSPQNSKAECIICTINNMMRFLLFHASIPPRYLVEGLHTTTYFLNCLPTKAINATSPYVALHGVTPSYEHLRVFGCTCYPNLSANTAHKLAPWSTRCVFLGYSVDHKATGILISPPTSSSPNTLFLMR
jgi:hypothetical protein